MFYKCSIALDSEFSFMLFAMLLATIAAIILIIIIGLFLLFLLAVGVSAGILSTSLLVAFNQSSLRTGLKAFMLTSSSLAGMLTGNTLMLILQWHLELQVLQIILYGTLGGLIFGFITGFICYRIILNSLRRLILRLGIRATH